MKEETYLYLNEKKLKLYNNDNSKFVSPQLIKYKFTDEDTAGQKEIRIVHQLLIGKPKATHIGFTSKSVVIKLLPELKKVRYSGNLIIEVFPQIIYGQKCILKLIPKDNLTNVIKVDFSNYANYTLDGIKFMIGVAPLISRNKEYFVQIIVDGAESEVTNENSFIFS
ncbi:MAG: hypothetical protein KA536_15890 [Saprospiraceae bacterium]|nr:hypothetical protein [Saprospiraceae bacterium]